MEKVQRKSSAWDKIKRKGSKHYRGGVEPIDLFRHGRLLYPFAIANIIKYAYRSREPYSVDKVVDDMNKVIHYAEMVKATVKENIIDVSAAVTEFVIQQGEEYDRLYTEKRSPT